ncbi:hypothetical protein L9F63_015078, partial [Diploptera punctata]
LYLVSEGRFYQQRVGFNNRVSPCIMLPMLVKLTLRVGFTNRVTSLREIDSKGRFHQQRQL